MNDSIIGLGSFRNKSIDSITKKSQGQCWRWLWTDHALVLSSALFIPVLYRSSNANGYDCAINYQHTRTKKTLDAIQIIQNANGSNNHFQFQFLTRISIQFFFKISNDVYTCPYSFITVHRSIHIR